MKLIPPCIPNSHLQRVTNTKCLIDTVISPDDGHIVPLKHVEKKKEDTKKNYAPSWFYLQDPRQHLHSHCCEKLKPYLQTVFVVSLEPESYSAPITSISTDGLEIPRPDLLRCLAPITRIDKVSGSTPTKVFLSYGSKSSLHMNCGFARKPQVPFSRNLA